MGWARREYLFISQFSYQASYLGLDSALRLFFFFGTAAKVAGIQEKAQTQMGKELTQVEKEPAHAGRKPTQVGWVPAHVGRDSVAPR